MAMPALPPPASFLGLPVELRQDILTRHFRSVTIRSDKPWSEFGMDHEDNGLAILSVCRQLYCEASPLALANVSVYCHSNAAVAEALFRMGPAQIPRLRHMIVKSIPAAFNLFPKPGDGIDWEEADNDDLPKRLLHFHLGEILDLFPGLQLELLEVFCGAGVRAVASRLQTDSFGSLLEANGFRRLWMEVMPGKGGAWVNVPSCKRWKPAFERNFKPYGGSVEIRLRKDQWRVKGGWYWGRAVDAGMTLVRAREREVHDEDAWERCREKHDAGGFGDEGDADVVMDRGSADFVVKGGEKVMRCMERGHGDEDEEFFKRASGALRRLFRENSWEEIKGKLV